jgi:hypothetical protein
LRKTTISRAISCSVLAAAFAWLVACGKKGDPLPPLRLVPAPAEEVTLRQVGDRLRLSWKAPARNEDGSSESVDLETARVLRRVIDVPPAPPSEEPAAPEAAPPSEETPESPSPPPPPFRAEAIVVDESDSSGLGEAKLYEEPVDPAWIGKRVEYAVLYENGKGRESALSEIMRLDPTAALEAPGRPNAEAGDGFVALSWSAPAEATAGLAFSVYRRLEDAMAYPDAPLNPEPLSVPSFEDRSAVFGASSCYVVSAVLAPPGTIVSPPSEEVCITPQDRFPPTSPTGLVAVASEKAILLSWREVEAKDLKGYRVYRGASTEGPFAALGEVTQTTYSDESAPAGETLFYYITAIDDAPGTNESSPSNVAEASLSP